MKKKPKQNAQKTFKANDICQRRAPDGRLVCEHARSYHKPDKLHVRIKAQASSGGYAEIYRNIAPTHCTQFCTCIAFIEKDGSSEPFLPISERNNINGERKEKSPFR